MKAPSAASDQYLTLDDLVEYSKLSRKTLLRYCHAPTQPLPHYKIGGHYRFRRSEFDRWIEQVGTPEHVGRARSHEAKIRSAVDGILGR